MKFVLNSMSLATKEDASHMPSECVFARPGLGAMERPGGRGGRGTRGRGPGGSARSPPWLAKFENFANFYKFVAGSFSAVSKRNFARKYAFDSIFQALQNLHTFAPLQSQILAKNLFKNQQLKLS